MKNIDYYISLNSPWTYLGHERLRDIAAAHGAQITLLPVDMAAVFEATGGLPVAKRAPARQAYRLLELERWRHHLGVPLNLHPKYWPADERMAAGMVMAARAGGMDPMRLAGAIMRAVWADERDIADPDTLQSLAQANGANGKELLAAAQHEDLAVLRRQQTQRAIDCGVFGAPSYLYDGVLFWGQDRLEFLERVLAA